MRLAKLRRLHDGLLVVTLLVGASCLPRDDLSTYSRSSGDPPVERPPVTPSADAGNDADPSEREAGAALPVTFDAGEAGDAGVADAGQVDAGLLALPGPDGGPSSAALTR